MICSAHAANYVAKNGRSRLSKTFYNHYNNLNSVLVTPRKQGADKGGIFSKKDLADGGTVVAARKEWLIRRLAEKHAPNLLRAAAPNTAVAATVSTESAPLSTASVLREQALHTAYIAGAKQTIKMLAPRPGETKKTGRLTNARATLRRCVIVAL